MPSTDTLCGLSWLGHPNFLQKFATTKTFIIVYGLLGTFQAMGYVYFTMTLQTVETRFKIPSQTTGIILSGNEVSQILLSVILAYFGGQRNRPRFIAWGVVCSALSCFILASPHFIFGAGEDALRLTKEWLQSSNSSFEIDNSSADHLLRKSNRLCMLEPIKGECNTEFESIVPLVLIFLSQFVLGVGNTLYYALGQTYLDDNTKKSNTPLLLSYAYSLRTLGPSVGFVLGFFCLKQFIDPTKTPIIDNKDPRWLGAWWLGWCFLGVALLVCAFFIGMFPKTLPKRAKPQDASTDNRKSLIQTPKVLKTTHRELFEEELPLRRPSISGGGGAVDVPEGGGNEIPTFKEFPAAMKRLFKNKILMFNTISAIFYILGASVYFTFMSKYMEVQFHKSAADAVIITGPLTVFGIVFGFLASGYFISKKKPSPSKLLMWNVLVGFAFMIGEISYLGLSCPDDHAMAELTKGKLNLTAHCNRDCHCSTFAYTPVCMEETSETFFNPCVAGCNKYSKEKKMYYECECARPLYAPTTTTFTSTGSSSKLSSIDFVLTLPSSSALTSESSTTSPTTSSTQAVVTVTNATTTLSTDSTLKIAKILAQEIDTTLDVDYDDYGDDSESSSIRTDEPEQSQTTARNDADDDEYDESGKDGDETKERRRKRESIINNDEEEVWGKLIPGACLKGCAIGFWSFSIVSMVINALGCSARIGNMLINYRCVSKQDKSVTQGLILMLISLFALIPGPILYGRIIDSTCVVWTEQCSGSHGNCQLYDQRKFRYYVNLTALTLTTVGVFFDILVWKYGRNLDLYGEREEEMLKRQKRKNWSDKDATTFS